MTNEAFIAKNKDADFRSLALNKAPEGIDLHYCLQQIEGRQIAVRKLPSLAKTDGIIYPAKISLEQCSSEQTALYKQRLVERLLPKVRQNARHNFSPLNLPQAKIHNMNSEDFIDEMGNYCLIYIDPSRRDSAGRKVVALSDCSPNIEVLQEKLLAHAPFVIVKLSPMLDIHDTLRRLPETSEVHVVSVGGECKEILLVLSQTKHDIKYFCTDITTEVHTYSTDVRDTEPMIAPNLERFLYEPNASIMKAGVQNSLCHAYGIRKLHPFSHIFTSDHFIENFPGRTFLIEDHCSFAKKDLKRMLEGLTQCNLTVRNFPSTVAEIRKRLKLREGGDIYLFATTLYDGSHALLRCKQALLMQSE